MKDKSWTDLYDHPTAANWQQSQIGSSIQLRKMYQNRKPNNKKFQKIPRDGKILFRKRKNIFRKFPNSMKNGKSKQKFQCLSIFVWICHFSLNLEIF